MTRLRARGVVKKIKLDPWWGLGFCSVPRLLLFGPNGGLLSDASRGNLYREEWEEDGRNNANAKRKHVNPSNDGLERF